ncbi:hypothetical protein E5720_06760 [Rhodococcus sp. PAMC28707]|uniref:hypothetical protein n=1 Tax=unclassified Rhodococcus (in: high G+C Gram-positive bacteria) TaxID=192944 RepID=UPI00109D871F|nr:MULTISPECIES: hypothetical protein [unclassified Rhodococcus (in: high G+C Gram-positive bacteria)]QCB50055.1 hypothetical protein E5769_07255 [Rhodococcus sp. PAMC28705]QCB58250.1 hypothetical protein E5720_06760 [Rhodococcus sp. PAMC28707]
MVLSSVPGIAQAQDADSEETAPISLSLSETGLGGPIALNGQSGRAQVTVPVPPGTTPSSLNAVLTVPAWLDRGWIDVESGNRPISRVALARDAPTIPISIPLAAVPVVGGAVTLDLASTLIPDAGFCPNAVDAQLRLLDARVDYTGAPSIPRTISEFLPPVLRQLTVFMPAQPNRDMISAVLTLTTSVIDYYGAQPVRVVVRPDTELQGSQPDQTFERSVVVSENNDASAELIFPADQSPPRLFVTGSDTALTDQVRLITSNIADLAVTTKALAGASAPRAVLAPDSTTLDDLGIGTVTGKGDSTATASLTLDQARLGRSVSDVSVHLTGNYTPGVGSITAGVGGKTIASWSADDSGRLDEWVEIPNAELRKATTLDVSVEHPSDSAAGCGTQAASTITVDGSTVVRSGPSSTPAPLGFGSLPQALMPQFDVAMTQETFADTVRAVSVVTGLQRLSARPIMLQVVSLDDALASSDPAVVIAADGALPDSLSLPLSSSGATTFSIATPESTDSESDSDTGSSLTVDPGVPYASLQVTTTANNQALLVASSTGKGGRLDALLGWLDADPSRWFGRSGDILFAVPGIEPVSLSSGDLAKESSGESTQANGSGVDRLSVTILGIAGAVLLVALVGAVVLVVRSRRSGRRRHRRRDDSPPS